MSIRKSIVPVLALLLYPGGAQAAATLHVGSGAGTACATGGCPIYFGEVNNIGPTLLDLYQNSGGAKTTDDPVLLILGIPNDTATGSLTPAGAGTITSATLYTPYPAGTTTALTWSFGTTEFSLDGNGFQGLMTSGEEVYGFLGLGDSTNNSNSFTNWSTVDAAIGVPATNFGIYIYALDTAAFAANNLIDIGLDNIPEGTFAVGYGYFTGTHNSGAYTTPFTEAGLNDRPPTIPEPPDGAIFAVGAAALLAGALRRKPRRA